MNWSTEIIILHDVKGKNVLLSAFKEFNGAILFDKIR